MVTGQTPSVPVNVPMATTMVRPVRLTVMLVHLATTIAVTTVTNSTVIAAMRCRSTPGRRPTVATVATTDDVTPVRQEAVVVPVAANRFVSCPVPAIPGSRPLVASDVTAVTATSVRPVVASVMV